MAEDILQVLARYVAAQVYRNPKRAVDPGMKLISTGVIDSMGLVDLAIFVENEFGVTIADTELNAQCFDTLAELAGLIEGRRA